MRRSSGFETEDLMSRTVWSRIRPGWLSVPLKAIFGVGCVAVGPDLQLRAVVVKIP